MAGREKLKIKNSNEATIRGVLSSLDATEIRNLKVRRWGTKLKVKFEKDAKQTSPRKHTSPQWENYKDQKVMSDVTKGFHLNEQQTSTLRNTTDVNDLKKLLDMYAWLLLETTEQLRNVQSSVGTVNTSPWNQYTWYKVPAYFANNPVMTGGVQQSSPSVWWIERVNRGGTGTSTKEKDVSNKPNQHTEATERKDAVAYNYQSIYKLDTSNKKDSENMRKRAILRTLAKGKKKEFIDIIETDGKNQKITQPWSNERNLLRQYFKAPIKALSLRNDIDIIEMWSNMEKALKTNPTKLSGTASLSDNITYWKNDPGFQALLSGKSKSAQTAIIENFAKLTALYVDVNSERTSDTNKYAYTSRLFAMMDRASGVDLHYIVDANDIKEELDGIVRANNDNVGKIRFGDGTTLLDIKKDNKKARNLLPWSESITADFDKITQEQMKNLLNDAVKWSYRDPDNTRRWESGRSNSMMKIGWSKVIFDKIQKGSAMDAELMLAEAKAIGLSEAEVYNIYKLAKDWESLLRTDFKYPITEGTRLMNFFADYNNNGKGWDAADFGKFSGAQLLWNYRMAVNQMMFNDQNSTDTDLVKRRSDVEYTIVKNLLSKVSLNALQSGDTYIYHVIEQYISDNNTWPDLISMVQEHPAIVKHIQKYLSGYSGDNLYALMFVDNKRSLNNYNAEIKATEQSSVKSLEEQLAVLDGTDAEKKELSDTIKEQAQRIKSAIELQSAGLSPDEQAYFKTFDIVSIQQNVAHTVLRAMQFNPSINGAWWIGTAIALTKNVQANLSIAGSKGGVVPSLWLWFTSNTWNAWWNINMTPTGANFALFVQLGQRNNSKKFSGTLQSLSHKSGNIKFNASAGAGLEGVYVWAGLHMARENDKLKGIETIANNIHTTVQKIVPPIFEKPGIDALHIIMAISKEQGLTTAQKDAKIAPQREILQNIVHTQLKNAYGNNEDSNLVTIATQNIIDAIMRWEPRNTQQAVEQVSKYMTDQWRNDALDKLTHSFELTKLGIGIGAFISPVNIAAGGIVGAQLSLAISKYDRGTWAINTASSYDRIRQAEEYGIDNVKLKMNAPAFAAYLNQMMEDSRWIAQAGVTDTFPPITVSDDQKFIVIPRHLWESDKNLTIKVAPGTQVSTQESKDGVGTDILIPRWVDMRMTARWDQDKAWYTLNVWSYTHVNGDHTLQRFKTDTSNPDIFVSPDQIRHKIVSHIEISQEGQIALQKLLPSATNIRISGSELLYTQWWVEKRISNGWTLSDGYVVRFDNGLIISKTMTTDGKTDTASYAIEYSFASFESVIQSIDAQASAIEKWENSNSTKIKEFYSAAIDRDYDKALVALKSLNLPALGAVAKSGDPFYKEKLVAYMTQAFALEEAGYKGKTAKTLLAARGDVYNKIRWSVSWWVAVDRILPRSLLESTYASMTDTPSNTWQPQKDLIGYTAFYRKWKDNTHRWYAMTLPWYTRVLWWKTYDIPSEKKKDALTWLSTHLQNDAFARDTILNTLSEKDFWPISPASIKALSPDNLVKLLTDPNGISIDGHILKIQTTPVYYLLQECANESIGLKINAISVSKTDGTTHTVDTKISTNLVEEFVDGDYLTSVTNAGARRTLDKRQVFNITIGWAGRFNTKQQDQQKRSNNTGNSQTWWGTKPSDIKNNNNNQGSGWWWGPDQSNTEGNSSE